MTKKKLEERIDGFDVGISKLDNPVADEVSEYHLQIDKNIQKKKKELDDEKEWVSLFRNSSFRPNCLYFLWAFLFLFGLLLCVCGMLIGGRICASWFQGHSFDFFLMFFVFCSPLIMSCLSVALVMCGVGVITMFLEQISEFRHSRENKKRMENAPIRLKRLEDELSVLQNVEGTGVPESKEKTKENVA